MTKGLGKIRLKHEKLAQIIEDSRMSQNRWAQRLGLSSPHLSMLVNGKRPFPNASTRRKLLQGLDADFDDLFEIQPERALGPNRPKRPVPSPRRLGGRAAMSEAAFSPRAAGESRMQNLAQNFRHAIRVLLHKPAFSLIAISILALGIGANTAIFSLIDKVLLQPLDYPQPQQLTMIWMDNRRLDLREDVTSHPTFADWRDQSQSYQSMACFARTSRNLTGSGEPLRLRATLSGQGFFTTLGVAPMLGRSFEAAEHELGSDRFALISYGLWQRRFAGEPSALGSKIELNGQLHEIVGIMPQGFDFPDEENDLWLPLALSEERRNERNMFWLQVVGRLKADARPEQAQSELEAVSQGIAERFAEQAGYGANVVPLKRQLVGDSQRSLAILMGAVTFVLLIACANVANLLLAHGAARRREFAVRGAMGAGRGRLASQLLSESLVLSLTGGAAGLALGYFGLQALLAVSPESIPRFEQVSLDWRIAGFTLALSLTTGLLFGLIPALQVARLDLGEALNQAAGRSSTGRFSNRARSFLVVAEIAAAVVLLVSAGLLMRSFVTLTSLDRGFETQRLLTVSVSLPRASYETSEQRGNFSNALLDQIGSLPGVEGAALSSGILQSDTPNSGTVRIEDQPPRPQESRVEIPFDMVSPGYFRMMGIELLKGRSLSQQDRMGGPLAAVINRKMAERYWTLETAVGKRFAFGGSGAPWIEVVGIVEDTRRNRLEKEPRPECYLSIAQLPRQQFLAAVRAAGDPLRLAASVRGAVSSIDPLLPVYNVGTLEQRLDRQVAPRRLSLLLITLFAATAALLACIGIYAVISFTVGQSVREIGVRMAIGASRRAILAMVIGRGAALTAVGLALGIGASLGLTRLFASLLYQTSPLDPLTYAVVAAALGGFALLACVLPARRATRVDPITVLRYD